MSWRPAWAICGPVPEKKKKRRRKKKKKRRRRRKRGDLGDCHYTNRTRQGLGEAAPDPGLVHIK